MDKLKERSEVSASDKWQIEKIYKNIEEFNKDYTWVEESFNTLKQLVKKFLNSKKTLVPSLSLIVRLVE